MDPFNLYLIQQKELYGDDLYIDNNYDEIFDVINNCSKCQGNPNSDIIFIGQESYLYKDKESLSLLKQSNQLLEKIISAISLSKKDVFITNILKVFYKGQVVDEIEDIYDCRKHLEYKLKLVKTKLIIVLGEQTANYFLNNTLTLEQMRQKELQFNDIKLFVTYNPSSLVKDENLKKPCWDDFKKIKINYFN